ncbi:serine/threonine-protein kinase WNK8-like [Chenopodium quinoa]|uniref:serine/threonine-protein kinase WNK8-like n=1 Tax=Chenopodium quinoa TaxID=63459 RepID=UPI000B77C365|nr:serine/threonine-protein kinase WNK8-like [Chenopodium quinoa]
MAGSSSSGGDNDYTVMETDSTGHYTRYRKKIDEDDLKKVYLGYDNINGREVAWCKKILKHNDLRALVREAKLLKNFNHQNIIKCYHFWVDAETKVEFNMITELYSGNLKNYTQKHQVKESSPAIKNWCQQILTGLDFLHSQNEPIIHNELKCENIFVVGNSGTIKLGDLSIAKILAPKSSPQYNVDYARRMEWSEINCVGLCGLQMVNKDAAGSTPRTMDMTLLKKVQDRGLKTFIQVCVFHADVGTTITDLLKDPFLGSRTAPAGSTSVPSAGPLFQLQHSFNTNAAAAASENARLMAERLAGQQGDRKFETSDGSD